METVGEHDPAASLAAVEIDDELREELAGRAARDALAPAGEAALARYVVYLGMAYLADEQRAAAAHDRMASAYVSLIEMLRAEIALREQRLENLRAELES